MVALPAPAAETAALPMPAGRTHNLPAQPTPLIGRDTDVAAIAARLLAPDVRLLTLTGPPGTGKTRLAHAAAAELVGDFDDGVWFVGLENVREADSVLAAIAQTLGVRETATQPLGEALTAFVAGQRLLLVLDNFEQVLDAGVQVAALLGACPHLKVLATSRAPLQLRWEHELPVAPLALPDRGRLHDLDAVARSAAVQLFVQRARALAPDFRLTVENVAEVVAICWGLDGLPLAIELAATRVRLLSPRAIRQRLKQHLQLLTGGGRDLPERQQTLRAAITWSYDLLPPPEQALFRRLGVFAGGWTLEAAATIAGEAADGALQRAADRPPLPVEEGLATLLDQSLLWLDAAPLSGPRYRMLETLRAYAEEQLAAGGELTEVRRRHAAYFLGLAEAAEPHLTGPDQTTWLARLEAEHDNLRAALAWALEGGDGELGLRLAGALWRFWTVRGRLSDGWRPLRQLLATVRPGDLSPRVHARALIAAGSLARLQGDYEQAEMLWQASVSLWRELEDVRGLAAALNNLGSLASDQGDTERAAALHEESLALWRAAGDTWGTATALTNLALSAHAGGDNTRATALLEESLVLRRRLGDKERMAESLNILGRVARSTGDQVRAAALHAESLRLRWDVRDHARIPYCLEGLAAVAAVQGQFQRAARLFGAAEALRTLTGAPLVPAQRDDHVRSVAAVRAALDGTTFAAAWTEGGATPLEAVVAYALGDDRAGGPRSDAGGASPAAAASSARRSATLPAGLTAREAEVLGLIAAGQTNREIAQALVLSVATVERHIANLYAKINARGRADATAFALRHGLA